MKFFPYCSHKDGFTLVELLVVIGILAILTAAVVIVLNPAELLKQSRDSKRTTDLAALNNALKILLTQSPDVSLGSASTVYVSLADSSSTCGSYSLPALPSGWKYQCATAANYQKIDGSGWIPVSFANGVSQLPSLPTDPSNDASQRLYYAYAAANGRWEMTGSFESNKYASKEASDGGLDPAAYEIGSTASLLPFANGLMGYWDFDEGSGTTASDKSGNGASLSLMNPSLLTWQQGKAGFAVKYDATSPTGCIGGPSVQTPSIPVAMQSLPAGNFSVAVWVNNPHDTSLFHLNTNMVSGGFEGVWAIMGTVNVANNTSANTGFSYTRASASDWHLFTYVFNVSAGTHSMYVDGVLKGSGSLSGAYGTASSLSIGSYNSGCSDSAAGSTFDEVRVYNRALSAAEIQAIYNATK